MKVLTAIQMGRLDAYTIEHEPIRSIDLMERAATALSQEIKAICGRERSLKVFAGPAGNGGDALAVSRLLSREGYRVETFLFNTGGHLSADCAKNRDRLKEECPEVVFHEITTQFEMPNLGKDDVVIDGLFGTGLNKALSGGYALLVKSINRSEACVVSIDIPSGMMCEDNTYNIRAHIIQADYTLTLQCMKPAFFMPDNQELLGKLRTLDIGLMENEADLEPMPYAVNDTESVAPLLKKRPTFGHKGTFGHGLLIAGSYGMAGAAILASRACMRSGIGKLTIHTPKVNNAILQQAIPEAVIHHDEENYFFTSTVKMDAYDALAIGPGLGEKKDTAVAFIEQISHTQKPLVIDADGLNILATHKGWIQQIPKDAILTPHPKEFRYLFGNSLSDFDMLNQAREQAVHGQFYVVLKGHRTAICCPNGRIYFNTTGNAGMATAGAGDALTGILLSLLAQGYRPAEACRLGVFLHGLAGDLAAHDLTEESLTASDIIAYLPKAFHTLHQRPIHHTK